MCVCVCVCVSDTEGPETSPMGAAALLLGCWGDRKDGGGKTEAFPYKEVGGRHAEPLLGKPSPHLWPAMGSLQISLLHIYSSVHHHRGETETPTFPSVHPSMSSSIHTSWQAQWLAEGPSGPTWENQDLRYLDASFPFSKRWALTGEFLLCFPLCSQHIECCLLGPGSKPRVSVPP